MRLRAPSSRIFALPIGCANTAFIWESDVKNPVTEIEPIASHVGEIFDSHGAFDVNPVIWRQVVNGGIPVRGGGVSQRSLDPQPDALREWVRRNLDEYWSPLAEQAHSGRRPLSAGAVEWCLLGPARMHYTLLNGKIISKEAAGRHALTTFPEHAPIAEMAVSTVRGEPIPDTPTCKQWRARTGQAMQSIIADAHEATT